MSDLVRITQRLYVGSALDSDGELEMEVDRGDDVACAWLTRREIIALVLHLGKVIEDADKEQETER